MNKTGNLIFAAEMISADEKEEAVYGSFGYFAPMTMLKPSPNLDNFIEKFSKYINTKLDLTSKAFAYAAISYDHIYMIAHAIKQLLEKNMEVTPQNLMQALRKVDFVGVTGRVAVVENTNDRAYMAVQFFNNQGYTENNGNRRVNFVATGHIDPENEEIELNMDLAKFPGERAF